MEDGVVRRAAKEKPRLFSVRVGEDVWIGAKGTATYEPMAAHM